MPAAQGCRYPVAARDSADAGTGHTLATVSKSWTREVHDKITGRGCGACFNVQEHTAPARVPYQVDAQQACGLRQQAWNCWKQFAAPRQTPWIPQKGLCDGSATVPQPVCPR